MPISTWQAVLSEVKQQAAQAGSEDDSGSRVGSAEETSVKTAQRQGTLRWQQQQWHTAFDVLFFEAPPALTPSEEQDDLLFFVYLEIYQAELPYLVRRKTNTLPVDLQEKGERAHQIDWKRSVLLNLVTQTTYSLTVCACQREQLQLIGSSQPSSKDTVEVSKAVYASTTKSQLNLNNQRANESAPTLTYPDISFAVENFEEAFESLLLTQPSQCYLVLLTATAGLTFRGTNTLSQAAKQQQQTGKQQHEAGQEHDRVKQQEAIPEREAGTQQPTTNGPAACKPTSQHSLEEVSGSRSRRLTMFSGFVSYDQLEGTLLREQKNGPRWLHKNVEGPHAVRMRGPGGQGFANVAVTCLLQAASGNQNTAQIPTVQQPPLSPNLTWQELQGHSASPDKSHDQKKTGLLGSAIGAAANVFKAIGNPAKGSPAPKPAPVYDMRCALMNLSLPMEPLALQLLQ